MVTTDPRGHRLRAGRVSRNQQIYMVTTVTRDRTQLFHEMALGRCVVQTLMRAEQSAKTLAYVVMPDHLHWLVQLREGADLPGVMHFVKSTSARKINRKLGCVGSVWGKGFYDRALRKDEDLLECARYIVANPLRAGLVKQASDYPLWNTIWT